MPRGPDGFALQPKTELHGVRRVDARVLGDQQVIDVIALDRLPDEGQPDRRDQQNQQ